MPPSQRFSTRLDPGHVGPPVFWLILVPRTRVATDMTQNRLSRMQFLRGDFNAKHAPLRPPWAIAETLFTEICTACGDCVRRCPENVLKPGRSGYPVVDFSAGECTFCKACVEACDARALLAAQSGQHTAGKPWQIVACIETTSCLAHHGVECRSCFDPCAHHAISMPPRRGGHPLPHVDAGQCNGCGACVSPCPVSAIHMVHGEHKRIDNSEVSDAYQRCTG